ncbi:CNH domain-containing protein [Flagelloscypha sp. PMI_526]|nr:CNH domain-containing protein [Flagelloscypha sp. PMI_526]
MTPPQPPPESLESTNSTSHEQNKYNRAEPEVREELTQDEIARQKIISELVNGEAAYVNDLENIGSMYIQPLLDASPPIIPESGIREFISSIFNNYADLYQHHLRFLDKLHKIQREQHLVIRSISTVMLDAVLQFREAYLEYIPNCPIATWRINNEIRKNLSFRAFVGQCTNHTSAHRLDMQHFISLPISRLSRYEQLLKLIDEKTPYGHEDKSVIPDILELIQDVTKKTDPCVVSARQKVELWKYSERLVFKPGADVDMNLLDENRSLIFAGTAMSRSGEGSQWSGCSLFCLTITVSIFYNSLNEKLIPVLLVVVITEPVQKDDVTEYRVIRRPIPLDLLAIINAYDTPTRTGDPRKGVSLHGQSSGFSAHTISRHASAPCNPSTSTSQLVYPFSLQQTGRVSHILPLFAESAAARAEWTRKLGEALALRKVFQETNKVFSVKTLSIDAFFLSNMVTRGEQSGNRRGLVRHPSYASSHSGRVTCSVPLASVDGRALVAIGCEGGVWIGFRNDPKSIKQVLNLAMVTQCAVLEDLGIFLVLTDKTLLAYHVEALLPSSPEAPQMPRVPQKLSGTKNVHFFRVGKVKERTLVVYMHKTLSDSIFRMLEPVKSTIIEGKEKHAGFRGRLGFKSTSSEWFRIYKDFSLSTEAYDLIFMQGKIVVMCSKGFEMMTIDGSDSMTVPQMDGPRLAYLKAWCRQCRPIAMYCSTEDVFLLCYNEFGVYVDKQGKPTTGIVIEWEGRAERATQYSGYILLFNSSFIEIRSLKTGGLIRFIDGDNIRCIWDGRDASDSFEISGAHSVHAVSHAPEMASIGGKPPPVSQHVFELIPTLSDEPQR